MLEISGDGPSRVLDARRSYSGWEGHQLIAWSIDPSDGSPPITGTDISDAVVEHTYAPGTYTVTLTVTDDNGGQDTASESIEIGSPDADVSSDGRVHGSGKLERGSGGTHDKINFSFDARISKGALKGKLKVRDKDLDLEIDSKTITSLSTGAGLDCGGIVLDGTNSFAFTAQGSLEVEDAEQGAAFFACGTDNGKHGKGKGTQPRDYFYVDVIGGGYSTGEHIPDNGIDGGNIHLHDPIASESGTEQTGSAQGNSSQQVLTLEPGLLKVAESGAPLVLAATFEGASAASTPVTLTWSARNGSTGTAAPVTSTAGVSLFLITMPQGDVEFTAWAGDLDSNTLEVQER